MLPGGVFSTEYGSDIAVLRTRMQWILLFVALALLFSLSLFASPYWLSQLIGLAIVIVALLGLHILTGLCGQVSIGHAAFMAVGAYTTAIMTTKYGINPWLALPASGIVAGLVGLFFGLPAFRLKMFYLAISTLAAGAIIIWTLKHFDGFTGGFTGLGLEPLRLGGIEFNSRGSVYVLAVIVVVVATFLAKNIQRTSVGRAFVAVRDNELAAEVSGIAIFRYKLLAFFIGCAFAGVAGWLWAFYQLRVNPDQFSMMNSIWYLGMLIIGGFGSTAGVFMGATFLKGLEVSVSDYLAPWAAEQFPGLASQIHVSLSLILYGVVIIAFMLFQPRGLSYLLQKVKIYYRLHPYSYWGS